MADIGEIIAHEAHDAAYPIREAITQMQDILREA
jgi:hypothetical protein